MAAMLFAAFPAVALVHSADTAPDGQLSLSEVLRVIQLFHAGPYHIDATTEDGFAPGAGDRAGAAHDSDYAPQDWRIDLQELLRLIQFYNVGGYETRLGTEDGFAPAPNHSPHRLPVPGDKDGDLLSAMEEAALGLDPLDPHALGGVEVDGVVLAARILAVLDPMPQCFTLDNPPEGTFCVELYEAECGCLPDPVTGEFVCLGSFIEYYQTTLGGLELRFTLPDEARHFMRHGSFSYFPLPCDAVEPGDVWVWNPHDIRRVDVPQLVEALTWALLLEP